MKFGIVVFAGSNCDQDCFYTIKNILKEPVEYIWHRDSKLSSFDCVILPGGFSYGDYLRAGAIARFSPIMKEIASFAKGGGYLLVSAMVFRFYWKQGYYQGQC